MKPPTHASSEAPAGVPSPGDSSYLGFFQFLRNFRHLTAFEQAELILQAALDPAIASKARKGDFVKCSDHFDLLQSPTRQIEGG